MQLNKRVKKGRGGFFRRGLTAAIRGYQFLLSPLFGGGCRFVPSCSEYALQVVQGGELWEALGKILRRILSCQQFYPIEIERGNEP